MESLLVFVIGVQFLHQYLASNAVRPEACSEVYEYRSWMRCCHTDNLAASGICSEACLQLASAILVPVLSSTSAGQFVTVGRHYVTGTLERFQI